MLNQFKKGLGILLGLSGAAFPIATPRFVRIVCIWDANVRYTFCDYTNSDYRVAGILVQMSVCGCPRSGSTGILLDGTPSRSSAGCGGTVDDSSNAPFCCTLWLV